MSLFTVFAAMSAFLVIVDLPINGIKDKGHKDSRRCHDSNHLIVYLQLSSSRFLNPVISLLENSNFA